MHIHYIYPADLPTVCGWLEACTTSSDHIHCRQRIVPGDNFYKIRLIDLERLCIIESDSSEEYACLSYVWGDANLPRLSRTNLHDYTTPGKLDMNELESASTIRDAIIVAMYLRIRYLWIDCLCIIQDDEKDLSAHISNMDRIYGDAQLTIVSTAPSASSGIPGMSRTGSKSSEECRHRAVGKYLHALLRENDVTSSPWYQRAWTLQEMYFSRRLLIFDDYQTFFQCNHATKTRHEWRQQSRLPTFLDQEDKAIWHYLTLLRTYVKRELSHYLDIINAFAGILSSFCVTVGASTWGIPMHSECFRCTFSWCVENHRISQRRPGFPSWSWCGWMYDNESSMFFLGAIDPLCGIISIHHFPESLGGKSETIIANESYSAGRSQVLTPRELQLFKTREIPLAQILLLTVNVAKLRLVRGTDSLMDGLATYRLLIPGELAVGSHIMGSGKKSNTCDPKKPHLATQGRRLGWIKIDISWCSLLDKKAGLLEFLILSQIACPSGERSLTLMLVDRDIDGLCQRMQTFNLQVLKGCQPIPMVRQRVILY